MCPSESCKIIYHRKKVPVIVYRLNIKGTLNVNMNDIESLFTNTIALRKRKFVLFSQMTRDTNIVFIKMYITIFLTQTFKNFA